MNTKLLLAIPLTAAASFLALSYSPPAKAARPSSSGSAVALPGATLAMLPVIIGPVSHPEVLVVRPTAERAATKRIESAASNIYR